jgi:hypothetical protein
MLEQAIIDAAMLREAALKNAEQSLIEKYAPQIKEAVEAMLEGEAMTERDCGSKAKHEGKIVEIIDGINEGGYYTVKSEGSKAYHVMPEALTDLNEEDILQEDEMAAAPTGGSEISLPFAGDTGISPDQEVQFSVEAETEPEFIEIDLGALRQELEPSDVSGDTDREDMAVELSSIDDIMGDLELDTAETADVEAEEEATETPEPTEPTETQEDDMDGMLQELLSLLEEDEEVLEEKFVADMGEVKDGTFQTNEGTLEYYKEMEDAKKASEASEEATNEEELEEETGKYSDLHETISALASQNEKLESVIYKLQETLEATLLSNAKLIYQNRTLSDASLNERQKTKIVEAIAAAESPKEARQLHETLKATVGSSSKKHGPQSLSESVNRRSNLSSMLNTRQNLSEGQNSDPFMEKMQKLAGIK